MKNLFITLFLLSVITVYGQEDGSGAFNALRDAIKSSVPANYNVNKSLTWDNPSFYKITYNKADNELQQLIYQLNSGSTEFSEMERTLSTEAFTWQDRPALYQDGSKTGMSSIVILLKNSKGKFSITNRTLDGTAMDKDALDALMSTVHLSALE